MTNGTAGLLSISIKMKRKSLTHADYRVGKNANTDCMQCNNE